MLFKLLQIAANDSGERLDPKRSSHKQISKFFKGTLDCSLAHFAYHFSPAMTKRCWINSKQQRGELVGMAASSSMVLA